MPQDILKKKFSLKDHLFNRGKVEYLGSLFLKADKKFKKDAFVSDVMKKLTTLELKARIVWIAEVLEQHLPADFAQASRLIRKALPPQLDPKKEDNDFGDFIFAPLGEYVVRNALKKAYLKDAYHTLYEITKRFSMEDAMRAFIQTFPKETLQQFKVWVRDDNYHVRRLVSESTRPRLPWSRRIQLTAKDTLPLLHILAGDRTRYVTRSVANHLNDIAKEDPLSVIQALKKWKQEKKQDKNELEWMEKHALRTLIKEGNAQALALLGYDKPMKADLVYIRLQSGTGKIRRGGVLSFEVQFMGKQDEDLLIDYVIDFVKANGGVKPKVFKLKKLSLKKGEIVVVSKSHRLLASATTYTLHRGIHTLTLQVNGRKYARTTFEIV
jgi:3-methyladenine DNA glycosylase AlkC